MNIWLRTISGLLSVVLLSASVLPSAAWAQTPETTDPATSVVETAADAFSVTENNIVYTVSGDTAAVQSGLSAVGNVVIPASITAEGKTYPVTAILENAFQNNENITSLTLPASVISIGAHSFNSCLKLASLTLAEGLKSIGNYAFDNCQALMKVALPASVESLGNTCFNQTLRRADFAGNPPSGWGTDMGEPFNSADTVLIVPDNNSAWTIADGYYTSARNADSVTRYPCLRQSQIAGGYAMDFSIFPNTAAGSDWSGYGCLVKSSPKIYDITVRDGYLELAHVNAPPSTPNNQKDCYVDLLGGDITGTWGIPTSFRMSYDVYFDQFASDSVWQFATIRQQVIDVTFHNFFRMYGNQLQCQNKTVATLQEDRWYQVDFIVAGGYASLYINGILMGQAAYTVDGRVGLLRFCWTDTVADCVARVDNIRITADTTPPTHTHQMTEIPYKAPTRFEDGSKAYWFCTSCDRYYADVQGTVPTTPEENILPHAGYLQDFDSLALGTDWRGDAGWSHSQLRKSNFVKVYDLSQCLEYKGGNINIPANSADTTSLAEKSANFGQTFVIAYDVLFTSESAMELFDILVALPLSNNGWSSLAYIYESMVHDNEGNPIPNTKIEVNRWYNFAVAVDFKGETFSLYLDGVLLFSKKLSVTMEELNCLTISKITWINGVESTSAYLDNLMIYSGAFDPDCGQKTSCSITAVPAVEPMENHPGVHAHYRCTVCGTCFSDPNGVRQIAAEDTVIPAQIAEGASYSLTLDEIPTGKLVHEELFENGLIETIAKTTEIVVTDEIGQSGTVKLEATSAQVKGGSQFLGLFRDAVGISDHYTFAYDVYFDKLPGGAWALLHIVDPAWANFNANIHDGKFEVDSGTTADYTFTEGRWYEIAVEIDMENDLVIYYVDGVELQRSTMTLDVWFLRIGWSWLKADACAYVDNIRLSAGGTYFLTSGVFTGVRAGTHTHAAQAVEGQAYYYCAGCGQYFSDSSARHEIQLLNRLERSFDFENAPLGAWDDAYSADALLKVTPKGTAPQVKEENGNRYLWMENYPKTAENNAADPFFNFAEGRITQHASTYTFSYDIYFDNITDTADSASVWEIALLRYVDNGTKFIRPFYVAGDKLCFLDEELQKNGDQKNGHVRQNTIMTLETGRWYNFAVTFDREHGTVTLYVNHAAKKTISNVSIPAEPTLIRATWTLPNGNQTASSSCRVDNIQLIDGTIRQRHDCVLDATTYVPAYAGCGDLNNLALGHKDYYYCDVCDTYYRPDQARTVITRQSSLLAPPGVQLLTNKHFGWAGDEIYWLTTADGTLYVFGEGRIADYALYTSYGMDWQYSAQPSRLVIGEGITHIGQA